MERTEETLKARVRETPLTDRLSDCRKRIGNMCAEGRGPRMCIPVQHSDDDFFICTTLADAQATVEALQAQVKGYQTKTYCAFCGQTYDIDTGAELIARHIKECPKHPMRDVEQQVEALRRERDEAIREHGKESGFWGRTCARLQDKRDKLQTALDAEREKVKGLEDKLDLFLSAEHIMTVSWKGKVADRDKQLADLQAQLSALQGLVRKLPVVEGEIEVAGRFIHEKYPTLSWQIVSTGRDDFSVAIADLLRYRRTLPATPTERGEG